MSSQAQSPRNEFRYINKFCGTHVPALSRKSSHETQQNFHVVAQGIVNATKHKQILIQLYHGMTKRYTVSNKHHCTHFTDHNNTRNEFRYMMHLLQDTRRKNNSSTIRSGLESESDTTSLCSHTWIASKRTSGVMYRH